MFSFKAGNYVREVMCEASNFVFLPYLENVFLLEEGISGYETHF